MANGKTRIRKTDPDCDPVMRGYPVWVDDLRRSQVTEEDRIYIQVEGESKEVCFSFQVNDQGIHYRVWLTAKQAKKIAADLIEVADINAQ